MHDAARGTASSSGTSGTSGASGTAGMWLLLGLALGGILAITLWDAAHVQGQAPPFRLRSTGFENGVQGEPVEFTLADYRGKTVVLDLMAVTCDACAYVTRDVMKPLWAAHGNDTRFAIVSIDTWADPAVGHAPGSLPSPRLGAETVETLIDLQNRTDVPWRHALDTDQVWHKYTAIALPEVIVVSGDGRIVFDGDTGVPSYDEVEAAVTASLAGVAPSASFAQLPLAGLAFVAGAASVVTPCTVGLLPAYFAMLLQEARAVPLGSRLRRSVLGGLAAAVGILAVYAVLALGFFLFGGALRPLVQYAGPVVGIGMVAAGLLALAGKGLPGLGRLGASVDGRRGFLLFGVAFALAGFGCTGPLFLPLLLAGFLQGPVTGLLFFLLYAAAVAGLVVLVAAIVGEGAMTRARRILAHTTAIQRVAGVLMVAAGVYVTVYFLGAPN